VRSLRVLLVEQLELVLLKLRYGTRLDDDLRAYERERLYATIELEMYRLRRDGM